MNLILLFDDDFTDGCRVRLHGRRAQHIRTVHRATIGDSLTVGILNGLVGAGIVRAMADDVVELEVTVDTPPPAALPVTLFLALPRPKSLKRVVQTIATMGVKHLVLMATRRVEKSFWNSPALHPHALHEQLVLGLEQARDTVLPRIEVRRRLKPFVEDEVPTLIQGTRALLAHPVAEQCPRAVTGRITLAVGPEGGFIPYELELFGARGFEVVSLGTRSLRVEQAVPALLGRLF